MPGELRPGAQKLLGLFGSVQASTFAGLSTADVWQEIRDAADAQGVDLSGVSAADVSQLRGIANAARSAMNAFQRADPNAGIVGDMIYSAPWTATPTGGEVLPAYRVRYQLVVTAASGEEQVLWQSYTTTQLPGTKEGLISDVSAVGAGDTAHYGVTMTGINHVLIEQV